MTEFNSREYHQERRDSWQEDAKRVRNTLRLTERYETWGVPKMPVEDALELANICAEIANNFAMKEAFGHSFSVTLHGFDEHIIF